MDLLKEMWKVMNMMMLMKAITVAMVPRRHSGATEREGRVSPLCFLLHGLPLDGERFSLWSLAFIVMMAPPGSSSMASGDDGPLRQGAGEGLD